MSSICDVIGIVAEVSVVGIIMSLSVSVLHTCAAQYAVKLVNLYFTATLVYQITLLVT